jgi:hypothetical protein
MNKEQTLELLMLLSALESWCYSKAEGFPDHLAERAEVAVDVLKAALLGGGDA